MPWRELRLRFAKRLQNRYALSVTESSRLGCKRAHRRSPAPTGAPRTIFSHATCAHVRCSKACCCGSCDIRSTLRLAAVHSGWRTRVQPPKQHPRQRALILGIMKWGQDSLFITHCSTLYASPPVALPQGVDPCFYLSYLTHCSACFSLVLYIQHGGYHHIALRNASERHRCTRTPYSHHRL